MKKVFVLSMFVMLTGCGVSVVKPMTATGGSKADGIVKMSYDFNVFEDPKVDIAQALATATSRCTVWGYSGAEPFGGETKQCTNYNSVLKSCDQWTATVQYQCTGQAK